MSLAHSPSIVMNGLILCLDAANPKSYPGTGTTWYDLSGNGAHGTVNGTVSFVSGDSQSYFNFAIASDSNYISSTASQNYVDMTIAFQPDFTRVSSANLAGLIADSTPAALTDDSLRFHSKNLQANVKHQAKRQRHAVYL